MSQGVLRLSQLWLTHNLCLRMETLEQQRSHPPHGQYNYRSHRHHCKGCVDDARGDTTNTAVSDESSPELHSPQSEGEIASSGSSSADEEEHQDEGKDCDNLHDIDGIIKGVLEVLNISQKPKQTGEASSLFKRQHKSTVFFPEHEQLQSLIQNEWNSPEHKFQAIY